MTALPSMDAEYLAPTTDTTGMIPIITPDRRVTKLRAADGHVAARVVKVPLDVTGFPITPRALAAHSGNPVPAHLAISSNNETVWPRLGYTIRDHIGIIAGAGVGVVALITGGFGIWVISR